MEFSVLPKMVSDVFFFLIFLDLLQNKCKIVKL